MKREKQLYKRINCALHVLPLLHSLRVEKWLSHFHCDLTWRNPVECCFSIDLTCPFLNFRVGVGQLKGVKCICIGGNPFPANLCWFETSVPKFPCRSRTAWRGEIHTHCGQSVPSNFVSDIAGITVNQSFNKNSRYIQHKTACSDLLGMFKVVI